MNAKEKKEIKKEISSIKRLNVSQRLTMKKYFLKSLLYSVIMFGPQNNITYEVFNINKENSRINSSEDDLLFFLKKYSEIIDYNAAVSFLNLLDDINEKTIMYYLRQYDNIDEACELNNKNRVVRDKKNFDSLIDSKYYKILAYALTLNFDDIKEFLNIGDYFWEEILSRVEFVDYSSISNKELYGVIFLDDDIKIVLPKIVNLETSIMSIDILVNIYNKYYRGSRNSNDLEEKFTYEYLVKKMNKKNRVINK